jgi:two-component system cell cycle sensor histidine kinase/response regulator CckA
MSTPLRVLIAANSPADAHAVAQALERSGFAPSFKRVDTPASMRDALSQDAWSLIIADPSIPGFVATWLPILLQPAGQGLPIILLSASEKEEQTWAVELGGVQIRSLENGLENLGAAVRQALDGFASGHSDAEETRRLPGTDDQLRGMADGIQVGLTVLERGHVIYANNRFCEILGYPPDECQGMTLLDMAAPEEQPRLRTVVEEAARTGKLPEEIEFAIVRKDGSRRYLRSRCIVAEEGAEVDGRYMVTMDITEGKLIEQESEQRRRYLERVLEAAPDAIVTLDPHQQVVEWNPGAQRLFGYSKAEVIGQTLDHLISSPGTFAEAAQVTETLMSGKDVLPFATVRYRKDGMPVDVIAAGSPILVQDRLIGAVEIYTDISKQTRAERLLQALNQAALALEKAGTPEEVFKAVGREFKRLGWLCVILLADSAKTRLLPAFFSHDSQSMKTARKLLGLTAEEFCLSIEAVDAFQQIVWDRQTVLIDGVEVTRQLLAKPFRRLAAQVAAILQLPRAIGAPLIADDEVVGILSVQSADLTEDDIPAITAFAHLVATAWGRARLMSDLTTSLEELKHIQLQLVQAQKMEAVGRLAGGVAHDFNNLLTAIGLSTEILRRQLHPEDPAWVYVRQIQEVGERAARLTEQLLSFSRQEMQEPQSVDLSQLVRDLSHMLQRIIGEDIQLSTSLAGHLWPVKANPAQMEQVIVNLVVNARDAMPQGGRLAIETTNVVLDEQYAARHVDVKPGNYVLLAISDTGLGMDERVKAHLFEPFFTTKGQGSGLGLSTVYGIVKQSAGYVWVYSEPGLGATFKIYLPSTEMDEATPEPASEETSYDMWRGTETVLVVEDDPRVRAASAQILIAHGYRALVARDGADALELNRQHTGQIHLLLTDVVMPQLSGPDLAERLRKRRPEMKVLYVSGHTKQAIANHGLLTEGTTLLSKPFTAGSLVQTVRALLDNSLDG